MNARQKPQNKEVYRDKIFQTINGAKQYKILENHNSEIGD